MPKLSNMKKGFGVCSIGLKRNEYKKINRIA